MTSRDYNNNQTNINDVDSIKILREKYDDARYWKTYATNYQFKPKVIIKKKKLIKYIKDVQL